MSDNQNFSYPSLHALFERIQECEKKTIDGTSFCYYIVIGGTANNSLKRNEGQDKGAEVREQFKVLVTGDNPESLLMSNMFPGRAEYGLLYSAALFRLLARQYPLCNTVKGEYL